MEPPAVTSCGIGGHPSGLAGPNSGGQQSKRDLSGVGGFIQIDPQISFNTPSRHFEELPENFLETISPQHGHGHGHHNSLAAMGGGGHEGGPSHPTTSPQLASLTTVSMAGGADGNSGYANLVPMPSSSHYISSLKMESLDHLGHHPQLHSSGQLEKTNFGNGPAGLLSPLQLEGNRPGDPGGSLGLLSSVSVSHLHRPNGGSRTSDLLSGIRRTTNSVAYIKEEINPVNELGGYQPTPTASHHHDAYGDASAYSMQGPSAQELERMANAETPPALSNVEITSSILASLSRDSPSPSIQQQSPHQQHTHFIVHQMPSRTPQQQQHQMVQQHHLISQPATTTPSRRSKAKQQHNQSVVAHQQQQQQSETMGMEAGGPNTQTGYGPMGPGAGVPRATYSTTDTTDPLNAEIDDEIYIDTKDLCKRVAYELKQHSIPQAIFAERILCRSQGTLSDLLRNPKPWNRLKSGRETFRRMFNWLQQPLHIRLSILDMYKGPMASGVIPPPTPAQNSRHHHRNRRTSDGNEEGGNPPQKRPRLVFTDIQKRTLQAIFKETQRPSREMQQTIAEHLRLDMSTVSNFFMNARRRSRNGSGMGDEPAPYQQVRTITPPPDSPPADQQQHQMIVSPNEQHATSMLGAIASSSSHHPTVRRTPKSTGSHHAPPSASNLSHIEETVDEVVIRSVAYARSKQQQEQQQQQQQQFSLASLVQNEGATTPGGLMDSQQQPPLWDEDELGHGQSEFMDDGSIEAGDGAVLIQQHKQEEEEEEDEEELNSSENNADLTARLRFGAGGVPPFRDGSHSSSEEMMAAASLVVQSFCRDKEVARNERKDEEEEGIDDEEEVTKSERAEEAKRRDEEEEEAEMVEAEAPTEPGTPERAEHEDNDDNKQEEEKEKKEGQVGGSDQRPEEEEEQREKAKEDTAADD